MVSCVFTMRMRDGNASAMITSHVRGYLFVGPTKRARNRRQVIRQDGHQENGEFDEVRN